MGAVGAVQTSTFAMKILVRAALAIAEQFNHTMGYKGFKYSLGDETVNNRPYVYWPLDQIHGLHISRADINEEAMDIGTMEPLPTVPHEEREPWMYGYLVDCCCCFSCDFEELQCIVTENS